MKETNKQEVTLGNLYLYEFSDKRKIEPLYQPLPEEKLYSKIPYDSETGNAHIIPFDKEIAKSYSFNIKEKSENILKYIKKEINDNIESYGNICSKQKQISHATMFNGTDYKEANYLFSYVSVEMNETVYDLAFNRFFIDQNNQVNCILLCFQIEMYDKEKGPKSNQKGEKRIKKYPHTPHNGNWDDERKAYYNFEVDIHLADEDIAKRFLDFVVKTEKKKEI